MVGNTKRHKTNMFTHPHIIRGEGLKNIVKSAQKMVIGGKKTSRSKSSKSAIYI